MKIFLAATVSALLLTACASTPKKAEKTPPTAAEALTSAINLMMTGEGRDADTFENQRESAKAHPLGARENPVRVWYPTGEREYLSRLNCPDGKTPSYERDGSFGVGPYGTILDRYTVECSGTNKTKVFMDMYHKDYKEKSAIEGFTIDK